MIYSVLPLFLSLAFLFIGLLVLFKNKTNTVNISFFLLALMTFIWQYSWTFLYHIDKPLLAMNIIKIGYSGIIFLPVTFYQFLVAISESNKERKNIFIAYLIAVLFLLSLLFSNNFISGYYKYFWGYYPRAGIFHPLYLVFTISVAFRGLFLVYKKMLASTGRRHQQLLYIVLALFIYFLAAIDYLDNYGLQLYPMGIFFVFTSLCIITYSIVKHNLMDINVFIRRSTVYGLLFIVIMSSFVYAHLNSGNIWVFIGQTTLAIVICSIALYKYSQYEIERDRKSAKIMQSEYERQLEYRTILDGVRNAVFGFSYALHKPPSIQFDIIKNDTDIDFKTSILNTSGTQNAGEINDQKQDIIA
ncbi:MAG TPA: hypothetical protein DF296_00070 [Candidatus Margulisbacteria bacterium]|nr:MAG: hypothetical protein A2X43_11660 [Candidatus Margulisbacteria bacterium GWD2_39_127]HAR63782.1 hypothetical protein [Candidatus Margulisiibacteriota bacterium]HCT83577.1 hypothetical protein [Candidatus Margulisiibacteriota bacterium]